MEKILKRSPSLTNSLFSLAGGTLLAIWVNLFTGGTLEWHSPANLWLVGSLLVYASQFTVVRKVIERPPKHHLEDLLRMGGFLLCRHAAVANVSTEDVRGSFHAVESPRRGGDQRKHGCLRLVARYAVHEGQDTATIDLDDPENKRWFFNVRAFYGRCGIAGDIDRQQAPQSVEVVPTVPGGVKGILSFPMLDDDGVVIGTVTYDSTHPAADMGWLGPGGGLDRQTERMMDNMVAVLRRTYLAQWDH